MERLAVTPRAFDEAALRRLADLAAEGGGGNALVGALADAHTSAALIDRQTAATLAAAGPREACLHDFSPGPLLDRLDDGRPLLLHWPDQRQIADNPWLRRLVDAGDGSVLCLSLPGETVLVLVGPGGAGWDELPPERLALLARLAALAAGTAPAGVGAEEERALVQGLHQSGSPGEVCRLAVAALRRMAGADWVIAARCDPFASRFELAGDESGLYSAADAPLLATACRRLEPLCGPVPAGDDRLGALLRDAGIVEQLTIPAEYQAERFGAVQIGFRRRGALPGAELAAKRLAFQVALALRQQSLLAAQSEALERLSEAQEQATEGARFGALAQMAGGVAHEFNNALGGILGRAQMLQRQTDNPQVLKGLSTILDIGFRAAETVKQLQEFTRERGDEEYSPVRVEELWPALVESVRHLAEQHGREVNARYAVETEGEQLGGTLHANQADLQVAVGNVVLNALEATPGGGIVGLQARCDSRHLMLNVIDRGVGMTEAVRTSCFDPFFSTKAQTGVGLGLSVTYGIVARHHGEIEIESRPGAGATVRITIPLAAESSVEPTAQRRILVIDDEQGICDVLCELFSSSGHLVDSAAGGRAGIELLQAHHYDLVCTDLKTADLSGWEVARAAKQRQPTLPVMLLTGFSDQLRPQEIADSGVDAVFGKPFTLAQILEAAERLLSGAR